MIKLTKLDNTPIVINPDTIKYVEPVPDTLILFLNGDSVIVRESIDDIVRQCIQFKAQIMRAIQDGSATCNFLNASEN